MPIPDPLAMKIQYYATLQGKWSMSDYLPWKFDYLPWKFESKETDKYKL